MFKKTFDDNHFSELQVYRWDNKGFLEDLKEVSDGIHAEMSSAATTDENMMCLRKILNSNRLLNTWFGAQTLNAYRSRDFYRKFADAKNV